jgi:menaquinol-cytochrome c reductase iron-sulfur subunit
VAEPSSGTHPPPSRRAFFKYLVNGIVAVIGVSLAIPLAGLFALPSLKKPKASWSECGAVDDFVVGEIKHALLKPLERREWPEDWGARSAYVYRRGESEFVVYDTHCTHVGCPVRWSAPARRFFSPCHGGVFDEDGRVLAGPPPRPLDRYEIRIERGVVYAGVVYRVNERLERVG